MTDCVINLIIILLVVIFIFSITKYVKMKKNNDVSNLYYNYPVADNTINKTGYTINQNGNTINQNGNTINQQEYKPIETKEITIICPINNNEINNNEINNNTYHMIIPQENVTLIEENIKIPNENNYIKEFSNDFHYFDPEEIYPSI